MGEKGLGHDGAEDVNELSDGVDECVGAVGGYQHPPRGRKPPAALKQG